MTSRRRAIAVLAAISAIGAVVALAHRRDPPAVPQMVEGGAGSLDAGEGARLDDFVGADACARCHRAAYDRWRASTHGRAGGKPEDVKILARFDGQPRRFRDATVTPEHVEGGGYAFVVQVDGAARERFEVAAVVGGGHMFGGGTQAFFARFPDGTMRFLPFDFARDEATWFCNVRSDTHEGLTRISPEIAIGDCADWPPRRVLGESSEHDNCQSCHGSQVVLTRDAPSRRFRTTEQAFTIDCEACHGPGRRHLARVADPNAIASGDVGMRALATLDKERSVEICFQCHALKTPLRQGYLSGKRFDAFYSILFSQLGDEPRFADGRTRSFAYQEGHLWSDCWVNGGMLCTSCHDPHAQSYRDHAGRPLEGRFDDRQCTGCHASKAGDPTTHTHHKADSRGSRCVACHMPFLQQPAFGQTLRYARSDHTIAIPRPESDAELGIVPACVGCHEGAKPAELRAQIEGWLGRPTKPRSRAIEAAERVASTDDAVTAARDVLRAEERHTAALFTGLARFGAKFLLPAGSPVDPEVRQRLDALARRGSVDVRGLALALLHVIDPDRRGAFDALAAEGDLGLLIQARWTTALLFYAEEARGRGALLRAADLLERACAIAPHRAEVWGTLGFVQAAGERFDAAQRSFERSLQIDPNQPRAWLHLGEVYRDTRQGAKAHDAWMRAIAIDDGLALAHLHLGEQALAEGKAAEAIDHAVHARQADPHLAPAQTLEAEARARSPH